MTEGATKEKPERQFEHKISAKAAHAAVEGSHHQVADGVAERHARLAAQHALREAEAHEAHEARRSAVHASTVQGKAPAETREIAALNAEEAALREELRLSASQLADDALSA